MKRMLGIISIVAASVLLSSAQLLSAGDAVYNEDKKDECLLLSLNCKDNVDSIQQRIDKLNHEISRGTDVYTQDELRQLKNKLDNTIKNLEILVLGG